MKRCLECGEVKPLGHFHRSVGRRDGRRGRCANCCNSARVAERAHRRAQRPRWPRRPDLTGRSFGRLTVLAMNPEDYMSPSGQRRARWDCLCLCGAATTVAAPGLVSGTATSCGCVQEENRERLGMVVQQVVGYYGLHRRLRRVLGPAKTRACVDCGEPAHNWSYDHLDPHELTDEVHPRGKPIRVQYSLDVSHYQPRCNSCHRILDKAAKQSGAVA